MSPLFSKLSGLNYTKFGEDIGQLPMLYVNILAVRYVALFRNDGD